MRLSKALVLVVLPLFLVIPNIYADGVAGEIAETRSALLERYERAVSLAEMSEQTFLEAAEAREAAAQHADGFIEAVEAGRVEEAVEHAMLADGASYEAELLEQEAMRHLDDAEAELDAILELAREYAALSRDAAAMDRGNAAELSSVLRALPDPFEPEAVVEPEVEAPEEVVVEEDEWELMQLSVVEGGVRYYLTQEELESYPVVAELSDDRFTLRHEGMSIGGDIILEDGMVGLVPDTFVGIPDETIDYFFRAVERHNVVLPDVYWLELELDNGLAVLSAEGVIDGLDYQAKASFAN